MTGAEILAAIAAGKTAIEAGKAIVAGAVSIAKVLAGDGKLTPEQLADIEARAATSDTASDAHAAAVRDRLAS